MQKKSNRSVRISIIVALCFSLPLFLAYGLFYFHDELHLSHSNKGGLITPLVAVPHLDVRFNAGQRFNWSNTKGHWTVMYLRDRCADDSSLARNLNRLSHLHAVMGKNDTRIKMLLLMPAACSEKAIAHHYHQRYSDFKYGTLTNPLFSHLQAKLGHKSGIFFVDPLQNIMMYYAPSATTVDIYQDLNHLLKVSQIG